MMWLVLLLSGFNLWSWFNQGQAYAGNDTVPEMPLTSTLFVLTALAWVARSHRIFGILVTWGAVFGFGLCLSEAFPSVFRPDRQAPYAVAAEMPSLATLFLFGVIGIALTIDQRVQWAAGVVAAVALSTLLGHAIDQPWLFFYAEDVSTGMAATTAIQFLVTAVALYRLGASDDGNPGR